MNDLLIHDVEPELKHRLEERARKRGHSVSEEAKALMRSGLAVTSSAGKPGPEGKLGDYLFTLLEGEYRGNDLVFEVKDFPEPPNFE